MNRTKCFSYWEKMHYINYLRIKTVSNYWYYTCQLLCKSIRFNKCVIENVTLDIIRHNVGKHTQNIYNYYIIIIIIIKLWFSPKNWLFLSYTKSRVNTNNMKIMRQIIILYWIVFYHKLNTSKLKTLFIHYISVIV